MYPTINPDYIALLISGSMLLVIPLNIYASSYMTRNLKGRKVFIVLLFSAIISNIIVINMYENNIVQCCIGFVLLVLSLNLLESVASNLFSKIIPSDFIFLNVNAGFFMNLLSALGRIIGSILISITGHLNFQISYRIIFSLNSGLFLICLITSLIFYKDLRVKAIARILRNQSSRKHKQNELKI